MKDHINLNERQKEIAYCILFIGVLLLLAFGDQIALHFIRQAPNENNSVFGENPKEKYQIDFLEELTINQVREKIERKDSFLLLSSRNFCETCERYLPNLKEMMELYDLKIYYIDREIIDEKSKDYEYLKQMDERLQKHLGYTPYLMYFKNGLLDQELVGKKEKNELEEFIKKL